MTISVIVGSVGWQRGRCYAPYILSDGPLASHDWKETVSDFLGSELVSGGFEIVLTDITKPWGVEFKIREDQAVQFLEAFFEDALNPSEIRACPAGPKLLVIEQGQRFSWHVHARKEALLTVVRGVVTASLSATDVEPQPLGLAAGEVVHIPAQIRHRLGSRAGWAVVAEISRNVFPDHPSDDQDSRRIEDDYGR